MEIAWPESPYPDGGLSPWSGSWKLGSSTMMVEVRGEDRESECVVPSDEGVLGDLDHVRQRIPNNLILNSS